jgi:hypothetical protein
MKLRGTTRSGSDPGTILGSVCVIVGAVFALRAPGQNLTMDGGIYLRSRLAAT